MPYPAMERNWESQIKNRFQRQSIGLFPDPMGFSVLSPPPPTVPDCTQSPPPPLFGCSCKLEVSGSEGARASCALPDCILNSIKNADTARSSVIPVKKARFGRALSKSRKWCGESPARTVEDCPGIWYSCQPRGRILPWTRSGTPRMRRNPVASFWLYASLPSIVAIPSS